MERIFRVAAIIGAMILLSAASESPRLKNIDACNGRDSHDSQIAGCTALIESGSESTRILALVYNNRGNAYLERGEYDRAIEDGNAPDFVEVGEAGIAVDHAMRRRLAVQSCS